MVDRIVPAATEADLDRVAQALGLRDEAAVVTEPFSQWVIEEDFPLGRPAWERAGAIMTDDVEPFEAMKLRLLNGPHSAIAYLGFLAGEETVSGCMAWPAMRRYVEDLMLREIAPTVEAPAKYDVGTYITDLLERFSNPALRHRTWQIAMDGSEKLPQRLLGTIRDRLGAGRPIVRLAHAVAAWMRYVAGVDERGRDIDVRDPLAELLQSRARPLLGDAPAMAETLLGFDSVFGGDLPGNPAFLKPVTRALEAIIADGARRTVERLAALELSEETRR
jgi:fructuronate reductase